ncbi:MAG: polysaccharide deacetylase family protein, partial [Phycisphaeraceae bacterium]
FFAVAGRLGVPSFLGGDDLHALRDAGMRIGCHGMAHQPWKGLSAEALEEELVVARERIAEAAGQPVREAACPFGRYDRSVIRALRQAGYTRVYTSDRGPARAGAWLTPRNTVSRDDTAETVAAMLEPWPTSQRWQAGLKQLIKRWR